MTKDREKLCGLTSVQAKELLEKHGKNELVPQKKESFFIKILHIIAEPMFLLLLAAAVIYFILGEPRDGAIMLIFVIGVISIDVIQEWKTDKTLNALKDLSAPKIVCLRDGIEATIPSVELVPGDIMMICEGIKIPADGYVVKCSDLCVDESSLTGEAEGVWKIVHDGTCASTDYWKKDYCYAGTLVTQGNAAILVDKTGASTEYGKIGADIASAPDHPTPLQTQTGILVKTCSFIAAGLFLFVALFTWLNIPDHPFTDRLIESILSGITLAMAMIPEEFPVILTVFLSMGAWRLAKKNSLIRKLPSVETLGSVSVLCVDKTGTITLNCMTVLKTWSLNGNEEDLCRIMGKGCETEAYDPMEKAMLSYCGQKGYTCESLFSGELITEYPFTNELKMMGHVWRSEEGITIAAKGSPEKILSICNLTNEELEKTQEIIKDFSGQALRVIAVGYMKPQTEQDIPKKITDCRLTLLGVVGLADPPRESVAADIASCNKAGIRVVMITGDNGITASSIAKKIGMKNSGNIITGDMLNAMTDEELREAVKQTSIFSRVIPEHKMRIVKAFKENGEVVAMTGDGVNDAPALKYADIGIAMGKRGSEVSREAADLILMDDNFTTIVDTVKNGRRIYDNIRKAVGYVFTIHIPIALAALLAPMLGIAPASLLLLPLHVVLLELVIDPTCSVVLERQPAERDVMDRLPRKQNEKMLTGRLMVKSVLQGLVMFASSFLTYYIALDKTNNAPLARSMGFAIIMLANVFLVLVNSSDRDYAFISIKKLIHDKVMWAASLGVIAILMLVIYTPANTYLKLASLNLLQLVIVVGIAFISVFWYEIVKLIVKLKKRDRQA